VWLTLPFYDFCGFRSVAVNSVYKLQFFYIYLRRVCELPTVCFIVRALSGSCLCRLLNAAWPILHVAKPSKNFTFSINNVNLPSRSTVKDLGVLINDSLTSQSHVKKVSP